MSKLLALILLFCAVFINALNYPSSSQQNRSNPLFLLSSQQCEEKLIVIILEASFCDLNSTAPSELRSEVSSIERHAYE